VDADAALAEDIELICTRFSKKRMVISLILFRCAKRFILPQKTKTSENAILITILFYYSFLTIQHKILFQQLTVF